MQILSGEFSCQNIKIFELSAFLKTFEISKIFGNCLVFPKPFYKNEINLVTFCEFILEENFSSDAGIPIIKKLTAFFNIF